MSTTKNRQASERLKAKKMSKMQMQQAVIKKKQCDAKALAIVEQLLESTINSDWLLQNLEFISKSHMEDVIEERSIAKLCGYVLCSKSLTVIVRQQYHISTRNNKVYDISKRKKFCSSSCYGAANFLLEQMLESPLWLREKDDIPIFRILSSNRCTPGDEIDVAGIKLGQNTDVQNTECVEKSETDDFKNKCSKEFLETKKDRLESNSNEDSTHSSDVPSSNLAGTNATSDISVAINIDSQGSFDSKICSSKLQMSKENEDCRQSVVKPIRCESNCDGKIQSVSTKVDNLDAEVAEQSEDMLHLRENDARNTKDKNTSVYNTMCKIDHIDRRTRLNEMSSIQTEFNENGPNECEKVQRRLNESSNSGSSSSSSSSSKSSSKSVISQRCSVTHTQLNEADSSDQNDRSGKLQFYRDELCKNQNTDNKLESDKNTGNNHSDNRKTEIQSLSIEECIITSKSSFKPEEKERKNKSSKNKKCKQKEFGNNTDVNICYILVMHVEQSVREWVTENTLCLLLGEEDEKCKLLENLTQHDRYQQLYTKLNRLELDDEREDRVILEKHVLKPLPHFSVLQEEGKKMKLKIRAFYEGRTTISEDSNNESESKNDEVDAEPVLPLTASHTPIAIRRRIFLDKLNKILPDLLCALTSNTKRSVAKFTYNNEKYSLVKILVTTFNLSAANIVFKTAEWTLVGLLIIKMLSLIDPRIKSLLQTKQATLYTSMILMSYKLDSNYLDRLIMEVNNSMNIDKLHNKRKKT